MDQGQNSGAVCMTRSGPCEERTSYSSDPPPLYDFTIVHAKKDEVISERFFEVLEKEYLLKGYHMKRDLKVGRFKYQEFCKACEKSRFILDLISGNSKKDRMCEKWRNIAHEVTGKRGNSKYPELLSIFISITKQDQRRCCTKVGRVYSDTESFWKKVSSFMLDPQSSANGLFDSVQARNAEAQEDALNNNDKDPDEKQGVVVSRKKHKVFRGLLSNKKKDKLSKSHHAALSKRARKAQNRKQGKSKPRRNWKLRKLLLCVPSKSGSSSSGCSPTALAEQMTPAPYPVPAGPDGVEHHYMESVTRMKISRA